MGAIQFGNVGQRGGRLDVEASLEAMMMAGQWPNVTSVHHHCGTVAAGGASSSGVTVDSAASAAVVREDTGRTQIDHLAENVGQIADL